VALIDSEAKRIDSRVVIHGPSGAGKSAFLQQVHAAFPGSEPVQSIEADAGTGPHELVWISLGELRGLTTRIQFTTTAGTPETREHRRMLLQVVDGIVLVVDALPGRDRDNAASLGELETLLGDWGTPLSTLPLLVFVNKCDLPGALAPAEVAAPLLAHLERSGDPPPPVLSGAAKTGDGVNEAAKSIAKLVLASLAKPA